MDEDLTPAQLDDRAAHNAAVTRLNRDKTNKVPPLLKNAVTQTPGSPSKYTRRTDEQKRALIKRVGTILQNSKETTASACAASGISTALYYLWRRELSDVKQFEPVTKVAPKNDVKQERDAIGQMIEDLANRIAKEKIEAFVKKIQTLIDECK